MEESYIISLKRHIVVAFRVKSRLHQDNWKFREKLHLLNYCLL